MTQELTFPANNSPATRSYSLDQIGMLAQEARMRKKRLEEDKEWLEQWKTTLKDVSNNADEFTLAGHTFATLVPGQLNVSRLAKELPDVHTRYMRMVAKYQFDADAFAKEEPDLFDAYRARRFCFTGE